MWWRLLLGVTVFALLSACGARRASTSKPEAGTPETTPAPSTDSPDFGAIDAGDSDAGDTSADDPFAADPFGSDDPFGDSDDDPFATDDGSDPFAADPFATEEAAADAPDADLNEIEAGIPPQLESTPCELETVYFDFDESRLRPEARSALKRVVECLQQDPSRRIRIEGHCDERGTVAYNEALGRRRAASVRRFLLNQGISADRLDTISFGETQPAAFGSNEAAWSQNRRAEMADQGSDLVILWSSLTLRTTERAPQVRVHSPEWSDEPTRVDVGTPQWE